MDSHTEAPSKASALHSGRAQQIEPSFVASGRANVADRDRAIDEARRVLKPGGRVVITDAISA